MLVVQSFKWVLNKCHVHYIGGEVQEAPLQESTNLDDGNNIFMDWKKRMTSNKLAFAPFYGGENAELSRLYFTLRRVAQNSQT